MDWTKLLSALSFHLQSAKNAIRSAPHLVTRMEWTDDCVNRYILTGGFRVSIPGADIHPRPR